ncbi:MAG: hypothetical protein QOH66_3020 [Actinomycetota bacterium]|nr:hypothetical protein [Actinomycetota bacterium]
MAIAALSLIGTGKDPFGHHGPIARRNRATRLQATPVSATLKPLTVATAVPDAPAAVDPAKLPAPRPAKLDAYRVKDVPTGTTAAQLLADTNLVLPPAARQDLTDGLIAQPVLDFLAWATQGHLLVVSVLKTGHTEYVEGTDRVSPHFQGRAVDVIAVDRSPVAPDVGAGRVFAQAVAALRSGRPTEVGSPWADLVTLPGFFSDANHTTHIHLGWAPASVAKGKP